MKTLRAATLSVRVHERTAFVATALALLVVGVGLLTLVTGDFPLTVGEVVDTFLGRGDGASEFVVFTLRLPRLVTGLLVGAALALSGAVLQSLSRNPLAGPDIIGFTQGSATGAIAVIVLAQGGMTAVAAGSAVTGVLTSIVVYLLALKRGVHGFRLVLIGIGVNAMMLAVNSYLITRATLESALAAQSWLVGGLNNRGWDHAATVAVVLVVLVPLALVLQRRLALLEMGDTTAIGLGVDAGRTRLALLAISVGLAAVATAAAGPIAFVALAAPQVARRLTACPGPGLASSALTGALLLAAGDFAVQRLFPTAQLPVGIATGAVGGLYLVWLLAGEWRKGSGR
ncbi:iron chelate uptake ABC transporter family permease subunit [Saccharothrix violaceirubra]|uniref:Iron complex transport system permease protein n=1 Tax=Saccharothrix violaceirubra TaxID=413306 RepID=A0A7W7T1E7_9PSEU|nr:iron chelate uptake ABC transporter family permease subunit [Saccharothrix violaceirubra]MBB4964778.1 iron complex transport system permease protein [Saccharothrix violaceirubra]